MNYNKLFYKPTGLSLKELKSRKTPVQVAYMINEVLNYRAIEWSDINTEKKDIWHQLNNVSTGEEFILWTEQLRKIVWGTDLPLEEFAYSLSEEEILNVKKISVEKLGIIVAGIISNNDYWIDKWNQIKSINYLNLEMMEIAGNQYRKKFIHIEDNVSAADVKEKAIEVKKRFGLKSFQTTGDFSYDEVFSLLTELEYNLENITDILGWDDHDFGADKLSLTINISDINDKTYFDIDLNIINLNLDSMGLLTERYANALDLQLGKHLSKGNSQILITDYATQLSMNIPLYSEEDSDIIKKSIKNKFAPKLKNYEKNNIRKKIIDAAPFILKSLVGKKNAEPFFRAFIDNRIHDYEILADSFHEKKSPVDKENKDDNYLKKWDKWKKDTLTFIADEEIKKIANYSSVNYYVMALIKLVEDTLNDNIELSWSWLTIIYEIEKNIFLLKQEKGLIHPGDSFVANKGSYTELFAKSFHAYLSSESQAETFLSSTDDNIVYPQGNELNYEIKWWKTHIRYINRVWKK